MNSIRFDYIEESYEEWIDDDHSEEIPIFTSQVYIDEVNLIDYLKKYELPFAQKVGHPEIAGLYMGNSPNSEALENYYKFADFSSGNFISIFQCKECMSGFCPFNLEFKIRKYGQSICWYDFQQREYKYPFIMPPYTPHKNSPHEELMMVKANWDYRAFGPFKFSENNYNQALNNLKQKVQQTYKSYPFTPYNDKIK